MRPLALALGAALTLAACGDDAPEVDHTASEPQVISCLDLYTSCEYVADRESTSILLFFIKMRDCAYDYGSCLAAEAGYTERKQCEDACLRWAGAFPTSCEDACGWSLPRQTTTSTVGT